MCVLFVVILTTIIAIINDNFENRQKPYLNEYTMMIIIFKTSPVRIDFVVFLNYKWP